MSRLDDSPRPSATRLLRTAGSRAAVVLQNAPVRVDRVADVVAALKRYSDYRNLVVLLLYPARFYRTLLGSLCTPAYRCAR